LNFRKKLLILGMTAIVCIATAVIFILPAEPHQQLILIDDESGVVYAKYSLEEGGHFSVTFKHSVNQSDTTDIYEIRGGKIFATGARYSAFGAGMPTDIPDGQSIEYDADGFMVIHGIDLEIQRLCYIVGTVYDHFLEINGETINLTELCGQNQAVVMKYID